MLLKSLVVWALNTSEAIGNTIKESYKQSRHDDDLNQPLSVQPWGRDGEKRRYWLIEGRDDTPFRLYRESNPARSLKNHTWRSVAGTIDELKDVGQRLTAEGTQASRRLADRIMAAIPRFEATEEKRKRREYRQARKAQFSKPEPGFSLYEGRTRGKRMRYTFSEDEDEDQLSLSDAAPRRATRAAAVAIEHTGPTVTASGRTVRNRVGGLYGEILHSGQATSRASPATNDYVRSDGSEEPPTAPSRSTRSGDRANLNGWVQRKHIEGYNSVDEMDNEDDATSSGGEWDGGDEDEPDLEDEIDEESSEDSDEELEKKSRIVALRYAPTLAGKISTICNQAGHVLTQQSGSSLPTGSTESSAQSQITVEQLPQAGPPNSSIPATIQAGAVLPTLSGHSTQSTTTGLTRTNGTSESSTQRLPKRQRQRRLYNTRYHSARRNRSWRPIHSRRMQPRQRYFHHRPSSTARSLKMRRNPGRMPRLWIGSRRSARSSRSCTRELADLCRV